MKRLILFGILVFTSSCSYLSLEKPRSQVELSQDVSIREGEIEKQVKANEVIELRDKPILISSPGYVDTIIVPVTPENNANVKVRLREFQAQKINKELMKTYSHSLNEILNTVGSIHKMLRLKKIDQALTLARELIRQYPDVGYLKFLEASCLIVGNQKILAKKKLEEALQEFPNHEDGIAMYISLYGKAEFSKFYDSYSGRRK